MRLGPVTEPLGVSDTDCFILLNFLVAGTVDGVETFDTMYQKHSFSFSILSHGRKTGARILQTRSKLNDNIKVTIIAICQGRTNYLGGLQV